MRRMKVTELPTSFSPESYQYSLHNLKEQDVVNHFEYEEFFNPYSGIEQEDFVQKLLKNSFAIGYDTMFNQHIYKLIWTRQSGNLADGESTYTMEYRISKCTGTKTLEGAE